MARAYLPADARCRQLERLIREQPGITSWQLALTIDIAHRTCKAYLRRLKREGRVEAIDDSSIGNWTQRFYTPGVLAQLKPKPKLAA